MVAIKNLVFIASLFFAGPCFSKYVSMSPSITESLYAVGLGKEVVGVSQYCQFPPEVQKITRVGTPFTPNLEKLVSLSPKIIFTQGLRDRVFEKKISALKLKAISLKFDSYRDILKSLDYLTKLSTSSNGLQAIKKIKKQESKLRKLNLTGSAIVVIEVKTKVGRLTELMVAGAQTYLGEIVGFSGLKVAQMSKPYFYYSLESFLLTPPRFVYLIRQGSKEKKIVEDFIANTKLKNIQVISLDKEYANIPGPRISNLMGDIYRVHRN